MGGMRQRQDLGQKYNTAIKILDTETSRHSSINKHRHQCPITKFLFYTKNLVSR